jgi:D-alanyl-D-alanine dipeptidase
VWKQESAINMQKTCLSCLIPFYCVLALSACAQQYRTEPTTLVHLRAIDPTIQQHIVYATSNNFVGRMIPGYHRAECLLTPAAANALRHAQRELAQEHYSLLVYDCYRPVTAVNYFYQWSLDQNDQINKETYYPDIDKNHLFTDGYIALQSGHSRGSTVDLTIIDQKTGQPLDMGTHFDFFGPAAHITYQQLTAQQILHRQRLLALMQDHGFSPYENEWWHFTLANEPYPNRYFNQPVV